jgi:hypothetical protein
MLARLVILLLEPLCQPSLSLLIKGKSKNTSTTLECWLFIDPLLLIFSQAINHQILTFSIKNTPAYYSSGPHHLLPCSLLTLLLLFHPSTPPE